MSFSFLLQSSILREIFPLPCRVVLNSLTNGRLYYCKQQRENFAVCAKFSLLYHFSYSSSNFISVATLLSEFL